MSEQFFAIMQIVVAVLLMAAILLQQKGGGLGAAFGGTDSGNIYSTRRGIEKVIFYATIVLAVIFFVIAIIRI